jgi:glycosyltransferase involved in cell wall biosynthesis
VAAARYHAAGFTGRRGTGVVKKVSVVIPARNEQDTILPVLQALNGAIQLDGGQHAFEIVVVVDDPADLTIPVAEAQGARCLINDKGRGKGNALYHGFRHATGDAIVIIDSDGSHNGADLTHFVAALDQGFGMVIGSRVLGGSSDHNVIRLFANALFTVTVSIMFGVSLMDTLDGYKGFVKDVVTGYRPRAKGFDIEIELVARAIRKGYRIIEIPTHESRRAGGKMKSHALRDGFALMVACLREGLTYRCCRLLGRCPRPYSVEIKAV